MKLLTKSLKLATVALVISLGVAATSITPGNLSKQNPFQSKTELNCLMQNVYHEARGEPIAGQVAVAKVTLNRAKNLKKSICNVVYSPKQFSWTAIKTSHQSPSKVQMEHYISSLRATETDFEATHFHAVSVQPGWAKKLTYLGQIGNHKFYK